MASFVYRNMRRWVKMWEAAVLNDEGKNKIRLMLDGGNLLFFFRHKDQIFGGSEQARVTFAKFKDHNDEDADDGWRKEASFTATNLTNAVKGRPTQTIFTHRDMDEIDVISDKEEVFDALVKYVEENPGDFQPQTRLDAEDDD